MPTPLERLLVAAQCPIGTTHGFSGTIRNAKRLDEPYRSSWRRTAACRVPGVATLVERCNWIDRPLFVHVAFDGERLELTGTLGWFASERWPYVEHIRTDVFNEDGMLELRFQPGAFQVRVERERSFVGVPEVERCFLAAGVLTSFGHRARLAQLLLRRGGLELPLSSTEQATFASAEAKVLVAAG